MLWRVRTATGYLIAGNIPRLLTARMRVNPSHRAIAQRLPRTVTIRDQGVDQTHCMGDRRGKRFALHQIRLRLLEPQQTHHFADARRARDQTQRHLGQAKRDTVVIDCQAMVPHQSQLPSAP